MHDTFECRETAERAKNGHVTVGKCAAMSSDPNVGQSPSSRTRPEGEPTNFVSFSFDGVPIVGRPGEPLAAALIAGGVRVFRTMPKTGEPRGGYCFVGRCADCLVIVDGVPNIRACLEPVREGMRVLPQHGLGANACATPDDQATGGAG